LVMVVLTGLLPSAWVTPRVPMAPSTSSANGDYPGL
jgi:hypothetical protein